MPPDFEVMYCTNNKKETNIFLYFLRKRFIKLVGILQNSVTDTGNVSPFFLNIIVLLCSKTYSS